MAGLWRVDFRPSNWLGGTRVLTLEERAVYIDIIMLIYEHGGPIADNPDDLCRVLNIRYRAKLESLLAGLERREKIWRVNGRIGNPAADKYIAGLKGPDGGGETGSGPVRKAGEAKPAASEKGGTPATVPQRPANDAERPGASPSVGRATDAEIQSNQGPEPPGLIVDSYKKNPPAKPSLVPGGRVVVPDSACRTVIDAFDNARAAEWGEAQRRPMPAGTDWPTARGWIEQGADAALIAEVAAQAFPEMHRKNVMPRTLSILANRVQEALAERQQIAAAGPFDPERRRWTSYMDCWLKGAWLEAWGPEPGQKGCDMPQHLQDEIIRKRKVA